MSLVKKRTMTKKRLEALAKNRQKSRGPSTAAGRERIRAANLRHGFYSKSDEVALRALGEDPAKFRQLLEELEDERTATATLRQGLAFRMARSLWRMGRADRMLDGHALRQAREEAAAREGRLHVEMMRIKVASRSWQYLAQSVARPYYVTPPEDLKLMRKLKDEDLAKEMGEVALSLFYQLRKPGLPCPGDANFETEEQQEQQRQVLMRIKDIFGLSGSEPYNPHTAYLESLQKRSQGGPASGEPQPGEESPDDGAAEPEAPVPVNPYPDVTEAQWQAREPVRQLLENILIRQVEIFEARHRELMRLTITGPSPYERAAEITPRHPDTEVIRRMEESNFRQLLRMAGVTLKLQRQEVQLAKQMKDGVSTDV